MRASWASSSPVRSLALPSSERISVAVGFSAAAVGRMLGAGAGGSAAYATAAVIDVAGVSRGTRVGSFGNGIVASARRSESLIVPNAGALPAATAGLVIIAGFAGALLAEMGGFVGVAVVVGEALPGAGTG